MDEKVNILAKYRYTIFHNEQNGYTVAKFITYDTNEEDFTATGYFKNLEEDVIYKLYGDYEEHPRYGMQFQIVRYEKTIPKDQNSLMRYFSSNLFPGIGKRTAQSIVEILGEDVIERIKKDPDVLYLVPQLNEKKRQIVIEGVTNHDRIDDTVAYFTQFGIGVKNIMKFESFYGDDALKIIRENPYRLVEDIDGIGFKTADKLAKEMNFPDDHPYRLKAAVLSAVEQLCMASGDTYTTMNALEKHMSKEFHSDVDVVSILDTLVSQSLVVIEENRIYHHNQYESEKGIAQLLFSFPLEKSESIDDNIIEQDIGHLESSLHIQYEDKQKSGIQTFFREPISIITGGPGTGKTTIVQGILSLYRDYYPSNSIALCAPTGRAAKRLSELSGFEASTIHSLLKWELESNEFLVNEKEPLNADVLIVDEFSMVDQWLFYHLLKSCKYVKKILLIGDEDQLPSVGCGCVLSDLIQSNKFPLTRLEKIFRQKEGSDVIKLAHDIRDENVTNIENGKDIAFFPCHNYEVKNLVLQIVSNALEKGYESKDIQVLAPMYGGVAGIDALNIALQKQLNPAGTYRRELKAGYRVFREGDKVLQLKNQPEDDVYNGDIGYIEEIVYANECIEQKNMIVVNFDGILVEYYGEAIYHITHAYCISIHKAQGSEYPIVILPIVKDYSYMLSKRLIYTGVTRAKKSLVLLGSKDIFYHSIQRKEHHIRKSTLAKRISTIFE